MDLNEVIKQLTAERDSLSAENANLKSDIRQRELIHVGFTNEHQMASVTEQNGDGLFYPKSDNECYIPLYMLNIHAHRVGPDSEVYKEHCERWKFRKEIAEIRAEAIESAIKYCNLYLAFPVTKGDVAEEVLAISEIKMYAAKVRQGGE